MESPALKQNISIEIGISDVYVLLCYFLLQYQFRQ
jgi:hypothetical protein